MRYAGGSGCELEMAKPKTKTRVDKQKGTSLVRGEAVVQGVLAATMEELGRAGYAALRIDDVAARAGVNKTTIYRRWPTKAELVRDAFSQSLKDKTQPPDTGSLRSDLVAMGRTFAEIAASAFGQGAMRTLLLEACDPEVMALCKALRKRHQAAPRAMLAAAVARGELSPGIDHMVLIDAFIGALHHKLFITNERVSPRFLEGLADLLLGGALARKPARSSSQAAPRSTTRPLAHGSSRRRAVAN